jgi:glycosyltransferase involved in cell wall biosynthesis
MEIAIVALMRTIGGIRTYAWNLIKTLSLIDTKNKYTLFTDDASQFQGASNFNVIPLKLPTRYLLPWREYITIPNTLRNSRAEIFHHTKSILPFFISCKKIVSIFDVSPLLFPEMFPFFERVYLQKNTERAVQQADCILTISENSKNDIINYFRVDESKVRVTYIGVSEHFKPIKDKHGMHEVRQRYGLGESVILFVGTIQPRKNIDILIRAYHKLRKEKRIDHQLVIVGRFGWLYHGLLALIKELGEERNVIFTGPVSDEELPFFYNHADIFVYPSSYEGFGLPVIEAMACGTPVITSNVSSLPEITGDAGLLVAPQNTEELADSMKMLLFDNALQLSLIEKGSQQIKKFSWYECASQTLRIYNEVWQR